ncbi:MAG TPA: hypothetical protein VKU84_18205, partial [Stellaceae bacterium]|nr:hypothetical protein [Stellaceae bacterium]
HRATYVFTDIERLSPWELRLAAETYRTLRSAGLSCLNDPARVMGRYELLRTLHRAGINPFNAYRAVDQPQPSRFPVFMRRESDHLPVSKLISSQALLDQALTALRNSGRPLRDVLVIEFCAEPIAPGVWRKFGTFRIGSEMHVDHAVLEDNWHVKEGTIKDYDDALFEEERGVIMGNLYAPEIERAFELGEIEFGRADHGVVHSRQVVYEINTNPNIAGPEPQTTLIRDQALAASRRRLAQLLFKIDSGDGSSLAIEVGPALTLYRKHNIGRQWPLRP